MASSLSREKLLFYAAAGGLGGFAAWGAAEPFLGIRSVYGRDFLFGALIGAFIAAFLASIEALSVGQWRQAGRGIFTGGVIGAIGGAFGLIIAEIAFDFLHGGLGGRILGWGVLGVAVGFGVGSATRSNARVRNGIIGGILGGALGGFFYQSLTATFPQAFGRAIAIIVLGALIGFFIGLVGELLKRGWLMVVRSQSRNAREGREYPLTKQVTIIGRAEECDIGLFGDQSVLGRHAIIRQEGRNFYVSATGGGQVLVNRQPVNGRQPLRSGDRLEVGGTLFLFRERAQAASQ
ncbi:MAG TPA: FHA domain-containing protein [Candidatus Binataceae bacterium]|nr:FHA domain-containing protein [Candidatus Binataceae bacterium]